MELEELLLKREEVPIICYARKEGEGFISGYYTGEAYEVRLPVHHKLAEFVKKTSIDVVEIADKALEEAMSPENLQEAFEFEYITRIKVEKKIHEIYSGFKKQFGKAPDYDDIAKVLQKIDYRIGGVSYVKIALERFIEKAKPLEIKKASSLDVWFDFKEKLPEPEDMVLKENIEFFMNHLKDSKDISMAISAEYYSVTHSTESKSYNRVFVTGKESSGFSGLVVDEHKRVDLHIEDRSGVIEQMFNMSKEKFEGYYPSIYNGFSSSTHNSPDYDLEHAVVARDWGIRYLNALLLKMAEQKLSSQHLF